ncbi:MAG: hypothetical protein JHC74_04100 [Thermoleophilia bacterium]|nr:hypothetical protein [Thermoleophilia bacterium]
MRPTVRHLAWSGAILTPLLMLAALVLDATDGPQRDDVAPVYAGIAIVLAVTAPCVVGLVILHSRRGNRIGTILALGPLPIAVLAFCESYAIWGTAGGGDTLPARTWLGAVGAALWPAFYVWPLAIALLFPDGRLPSPRWRRAAIATFTAPAVVVLGILIGQESLTSSQGGGPNPFFVDPPPVAGVVFWAAWLVMFAGLFIAAAAVVVRYRRAGGVERLQLKWLAWSAALIPLGLVACVISYAVVGEVTLVVPLLLLAAGVAISVSVGIAVTRHGLYEIDRIVNRTLVYVVLTALLGVAFAAVILAGGVLAGRGSPIATAVATLAVTLTFRPVRARVQSVVDRRFARARYEGLRHMRAFEDAVRRGEAEPEDVGRALATALGDPGAELWLRLPQSEVYAGVDGRLIGVDQPSGDRAATRVAPRGEELAVVVHDPSLRERPDLLRSVVSAAALPVELARLRVELRVQLAEVEASRARLVNAGDEERRRLERDLHDGAQQRLVGLGVALRRMQRSLPREARVLVPALDQAVNEVGNAIADLRTIAAGLRPPRLDDGLAAALADLARSAPLPVSVRVQAEDLPAPIEVAAYYVVCEAVTNAVKHGRTATRIDVEAVRDGGRLRVRVDDDGAGGAVARAGSGLSGIADRVGAHGGTLRIESPPGAGTHLVMELPCAS